MLLSVKQRALLLFYAGKKSIIGNNVETKNIRRSLYTLFEYLKYMEIETFYNSVLIEIR